MSTQILQVRDVPSDEVAALRSRASALNMSVSAYLRELIHEDTSRPTMAEIIGRVASRESIEAAPEDIRSFIDDSRPG